MSSKEPNTTDLFAGVHYFSCRKIICLDYFFTLTFLGGVDYKGVREIMKNCIDKIQALPTSVGVVQVL